MHPIVDKIKQECWDGMDKHPQGKICNFKHDNDMISAEGVQRQIDSSLSDAGMIFVLNKDLKLQRYFFEDKNENV